MANLLEWIRRNQETVERWVIGSVMLNMLAFGVVDKCTNVFH